MLYARICKIAIVLLQNQLKKSITRLCTTARSSLWAVGCMQVHASMVRSSSLPYTLEMVRNVILWIF
jgi:hypothetical protein